MLSVTITLLKLEESWKGSTNSNLHRQFFIGNAIVFGQQFLRKPRGTLEYPHPVRLDELEICIRLSEVGWWSVYSLSQQAKRSVFADIQDWLNPTWLEVESTNFPKFLATNFCKWSVSRVSLCTAWNMYRKDVENLRSVSKQSQSTWLLDRRYANRFVSSE